MMSKSATLPASAPTVFTKNTQPAQPPAAAASSTTAIVRKDGGGGSSGSKRTVTNVRKAIEDAAMYNTGKEATTHDNDYEDGKATTRKDRKAAQDEDRKMVEELNAWGRTGWDDDDGDDF